MQPYRTTRPHDAADCFMCSPLGQGHQLCQGPDCDGLAAYQTARHATQAEYDAIPDQFKPVDGIALLAVFACDSDPHAEATIPFCTHPEPAPLACPTCSATGEAPCTTAAGTPRTLPHAERGAALPVLEVCRHAHREDCDVFTGCQCTPGDEPPAREPRPRAAPPQLDGSRLLIPFELAHRIVDHWDIPWWTVVDIASVTSQDNLPALRVEYATLDDDANIVFDDHGKKVTKTVMIVLDENAPRPPIPVTPTGP